ncbi:MAG TPA: pirin family protein [Frankiaceae bacterium]|nr:pirin family protein [Frankiaceae bacterium]
MTDPAPRTDIRRSGDRFRTRTDWLDSHHSFSFGEHYDPDNTSYGVLLVHNEDVLAPGGGFDTHPHRETEIVTWVLDGSLTHEDSAGHRGITRPGLVQRMSAGSGIEHSERNGSQDSPVHYVQMWVAPDEFGTEAGYEQLEVDDGLLAAGLVPVASGLDRHLASPAVRLRNRSAALSVARPPAGAEVLLPAAPFLHLFVARGTVHVEGIDTSGQLAAGDAGRFTGAVERRVTAETAAEILVWEMHASIG